MVEIMNDVWYSKTEVVLNRYKATSKSGKIYYILADGEKNAHIKSAKNFKEETYTLQAI